MTDILIWYAVTVNVRFVLCGTLQASLSGTYLQTLPESVTPLKGHSFYFHTAVHLCCQRSPKGLGTNKAESNTVSKFSRLHEARLPQGRKIEFYLSANNFGFICAGISNVDY